MKKTLIFAAGAALALASCDLDINENPNYPSTENVTPDLVFPAAQNAVAAVVGDELFNCGGFFAQYFEQRPETNQYNDLAELNLDESSDELNRSYSAIYAGALADIKDIMDRDDNAADLFACTVLRAQALTLMVDCFSDAPYTEALMGSANANPKWDDGKTIYEGVLAEMDAAEAKLDGQPMTLKDAICGGSTDAWQRYANALRLRMLLRLIDANIDAAANTQKVQALLAKAQWPEDGVSYDVYSNSEGQWNPWYAAKKSLGANNHVPAYPIVSYYAATGDPRMAYAIKVNAKEGKYVGQLPGCKTLYKEWTGAQWLNKEVSEINYEVMADAAISLVSASEVHFLVAEAQLRFNHDAAAAKAAYEAGVRADFGYRGIAGADDLLAGANTAFDSQATDEAKLHLIYMQKWAALFMVDHFEAWSEARRTDVPTTSAATAKQVYDDPSLYTAGDFILPGLNYKAAGKLIKRLPYPSSARRYNKNMPAVKTIADPVFWDVK